MGKPLTVLALDPSSTCCGFALGEVDPHRGVVVRWREIGRFTPDRGKDPWDVRIDAICRELNTARAQWGSIDVCVVEAPAKPQRRQGTRSTATMWVYGMAVGAIMQAASGIGSERLLVDPADWAKGRGDKEHHKLQAASVCPLYDAAVIRDPGGDIADAVLILNWWAERERGRGAGEAAGSRQQAAGKKRRRAG